MNDKIEKLSTEFYQIIYSLKEISNNYYEGQVFVIRKDTEEESKLYFCEYGNNAENIENKLYQSLLKKSSFLKEKPVDWNSTTKKILAQLKALENHKTSFYVKLEKSVKSGIFEKFMSENYGSFLNLIIEQTKVLVVAIEKLKPSERKSLLISQDDVYSNPTDPWNLDDLTLRYRIFSFFNNPSAEETQLHKMHVEKQRGKKS